MLTDTDQETFVMPYFTSSKIFLVPSFDLEEKEQAKIDRFLAFLDDSGVDAVIAKEIRNNSFAEGEQEPPVTERNRSPGEQKHPGRRRLRKPEAGLRKAEAQKERAGEGVGRDDAVFPRPEPRQAVPLLPDGQPDQVLEGSGKPRTGRVPQAERQEALEEGKEDQPEDARGHGTEKKRKMSRSTSVAC